MDSITGNEAKQINLLDSLNSDWLKLPMAVMREVGPAVQTLSGLLKLTSKETFTPVQTIAIKARLPLCTSRKHLDILASHGWIVNAGREHTKRGSPRRTCTIRVTEKAIEASHDYGVLPWWFTGGYSWSERALLSVVMARLMAMKATIEEEHGNDLEADDFWGCLENIGGDDRFRLSLGKLEEVTGLSRPAIVRAKLALQQHGIVRWQAEQRDDGGSATDLLIYSKSKLQSE